MASIDKTYVTKVEYVLARQFWLDTYDQQVRELGFAQWLYPFSVYGDTECTREFIANNTLDVEEFLDEGVLWNTGSTFDLWLAKNCKLDFITDRLSEQYGQDWFGFKYANELDFSEKPCIVSIEYSCNGQESMVYLFRDKGEDLSDEEVFIHDDIIVYGTTYYASLFHDAYNIIGGRRARKHVSGLTVVFEYYGLSMKCVDGKLYMGDEKVTLNISTSGFFKPNIKHSYDLSDSVTYRDEEIFLSSENETFNITQFKDFDRSNINRCVRQLPDYILEHIKLGGKNKIPDNCPLETHGSTDR